MKAVLVIDIPNDIDSSKVRIGGDGNIYYMRDGERASIVGNIRNIKPIPSKQKVRDSILPESVQGFNEGWKYGWNACLHEITGETE